MKIWNKLVNRKGKIKKSTGDFDVRQGVTQEPLADVDFFGKPPHTLVSCKRTVSMCLDLVPLDVPDLVHLVAQLGSELDPGLWDSN